MAMASRKRRAIIRQLHNRKTSAIFLQETYSSEKEEKVWSAEWGRKIYFNHGTKHSKAIAILIDPKLQVTVEKELRCKSSRVLILQISIDQAKYTCVNVYAPNDPTAQCNFYRNLRDTLHQFSSDGLIISGDFNCPLNEQDEEGGRKISSRANSTSLIKELMETFDLSDVWKELHPNEKQFTWAIGKYDVD